MEKEMNLDKIFSLLTASIIFSLAIIGVYSIYNIITADGKIQSCYINDGETSSRSYYLKGRVDWRIDETIAGPVTQDEAIRIANAIGCKLQ